MGVSDSLVFSPRNAPSFRADGGCEAKYSV